MFQVMMPELDGGGFGEFASLVKRRANPRADVSGQNLASPIKFSLLL